MEKKEITILPVVYDLILWHSPKISHYPKKYKYTLGERITNCLLDILDSIIEAKYASKKKNHFLRKANLDLEKLRFMIRLSKDLFCINIKSYEYVSLKMYI
jgi:hypothetical protein